MMRLAVALTIWAAITTSSRSESALTTVVRRYPNGAVEYVRTYRDGKEEGVHRAWWPNGSRKFEYHYHNGLAEGSQREWFQDGSPYTEFNYVAGHEAGLQRMWTSYGKLRANYIVKDSRRYGLIGAMGCRGDSTARVK
jgi:antitoxin component YwqK of YwqJK toxin-antitoxin module